MIDENLKGLLKNNNKDKKQNAESILRVCDYAIDSINHIKEIIAQTDFFKIGCTKKLGTSKDYADVICYIELIKMTHVEIETLDAQNEKILKILEGK